MATFYKSNREGEVFCDTTISIRISGTEIVEGFISSMIYDDDEVIKEAWDKATSAQIMKIVKNEIIITGEARYYRICDHEKFEISKELEEDFWDKFNLVKPDQQTGESK